MVSWRDERQLFRLTLSCIVSLEITIGSHIGTDNTAIVSIDVPKRSPLCLCRFDLMGLTPNCPEDESGIKKAAEDSEFNVAVGFFCFLFYFLFGTKLVYIIQHNMFMSFSVFNQKNKTIHPMVKLVTLCSRKKRSTN